MTVVVTAAAEKGWSGVDGEFNVMSLIMSTTSGVEGEELSGMR